MVSPCFILTLAAPDYHTRSVARGLPVDVDLEKLAVGVGEPAVLYLLAAGDTVYASDDGGLTWSGTRLVDLPPVTLPRARASLGWNGAPFSVNEPLKKYPADSNLWIDTTSLGDLDYDSRELTSTPEDSPIWLSTPYPAVAAGSAYYLGAVESPGFFMVWDEGGWPTDVAVRAAPLAGPPAPAGLDDLEADPRLAGVAVVRGAAGGFRTRDGGRSWRRAEAGELPSLGREADADRVALYHGDVVAVTPHPREPARLLAATRAQILESKDDGQSWRVIFSAEIETVRDAAYDPARPNAVFVLTSGQLLQLVPAPEAASSAAELRGHLAREPHFEVALDAALGRHGLSTEARAEVGARADLAGRLPTVSLGFGVMKGGGRMGLSDRLASAVSYLSSADYHKEIAYAVLILSWDLDRLLFDGAELDPRLAASGAERERVTTTLRRLIDERHRLLSEWFEARPGGLRSRLMLRLRIQEVTEQLDVLCDGAWEQSLASLVELEPQG